MPYDFLDVNLSHPQYTGYLTKRSKWLHSWRRRYFILKNDKLYYAEDKHSKPHGVIDLSMCQTVKSADDKTHKKHSLEVTTNEDTYFMFADSEKEKDSWIGAIGRAIVHSSMNGSDSD